jgi:hypothetical protein
MKKLIIVLAMLGGTAYAQCPSIYAEPYTDCQSGNIFLNATPGFATYSWSPSSGVSNPAIANPIATAAGTYIVTATTFGPELVVNGDFSAGNTGFTSGQTYSSVYTPCDYYVANGWFGTSFGSSDTDHTPTTDNMYMSIDGCSTGPTVIWQETISVANNTGYTFSFWATDADAVQPTYEIHFIGDVTGDNVVATLTGIIPGLSASFHWSQYLVSCWNSSKDNNVTIKIINLQTNGYGNDFGMDDFSFRQCCTSTYTVTTPSSAMSANLFTNGNFSAGNTGFTSGQTYSTTYTPCDYYVGAGWFSPTQTSATDTDHTPNADNMYMSVDGCTTAPTVIWQETVSVVPGSMYQFSFWATDAYLTQPKYEIHFIGNISGDNVVATINGTAGTSTGWNWTEYGVKCWTDSRDKILTVRIVNLQTAYMGNDFGMDDFSFRRCCNRDCCDRFASRNGNNESNTIVRYAATTISPNPNNGSFIVNVADPSADSKVTLLNLLGEKIDDFTFSGGSYQYVPKTNIKPGMYIIQVNNGGTLNTMQIVVE